MIACARPAAVQHAFLIGIGPDAAFDVARQIRSDLITWQANYPSFSALDQAPAFSGPVILLADVDGGFDALDHVLEEHQLGAPHTPMIIQISKPAVRAAVTAMQRGAIDVLVKPYTVPRLASALRDAVQLRRVPRFS